MKKPEFPENEETRLACLQSLDILDTPAEERFDRYTRLVQKVLNVPIALVSLVDTDRQWFKSSQGLDASQTSREVSFCGHTILDESAFIVNNALEDLRFSDNPLVTGPPHIRAYAGAPLTYVDGSRLGTLCVIDTQPRQFSDSDIEILTDIASLVVRELETVQLAILDDLTGISNRRGFNVLAQKSLNIGYRNNTPAVLIFFDLNGFKGINDNFGHAEGDRALVSFAQVMKQFFRNSDIFARLGGDEFAVLLTNTNTEQAQTTLDLFREQLAELNAHSNKGYHIEFCAGVIGIDSKDPLSVDVLLDMADTVMYENKNINSEIKLQC